MPSLQPLFVTSCTNRKRNRIAGFVQARSLTAGSISEVARQWRQLLDQVPKAKRLPVTDLYCGRTFTEAVRTASQQEGLLYVVSAGLGLVESTDSVAPYDLTVSAGSPDSIARKINGDFTPGQWWSHVCQPGFTLHEVIARHAAAPIGIALPSNYLRMVQDDLLQLPDEVLRRVRLFCGLQDVVLPDRLAPLRMPYDDRLDGEDSPLNGTKGDFAQRAMQHYFENIAQPGSMLDPAVEAERVRNHIKSWHRPPELNRESKTDDEIIELINIHWDSVNGLSSKMLMKLRRELHIRCEQTRFKNIFNKIKADRTEKNKSLF